MTRSTLTLATLACSLTAGAASHAVVITTADGIGADNQIQGKNFADRELINKGASTTLELRANGNPANNFVGVLRFDLAAVTDNVADATLSVTLASSPSVNTELVIYALNEGSAGGGPDGSDQDELSETAYAEGGSSFSVQPIGSPNLVGDIAPGFDELATGPSMVSSDATLIGTVAIASGTPADTKLSVSDPALVDALNADTNGAVVFYLFNTNSAETYTLYTADGSNAAGLQPTLEVTLVPEPGSMALAMIGCGLCWLRRRSTTTA